MANEQNLKPFTSDQDRELAAINGRKGGLARGKQRRQRKAMREQMEMLLSMPSNDKRIKAKLDEMGVNSNDMDNQMALIVSTYLQALKGNTNAINIVRELVGERVTEINVNASVDEKAKELDDILKKI